MKKLLIAVSLLSAVSLTGCKDDAGKAFVGKWQGEGIVSMTEENGNDYFIDITKNNDNYFVDLNIPGYKGKTDHLKYIAKLSGDALISGDGVDQEILAIDNKTGELITTFKENIKYKKITSK